MVIVLTPEPSYRLREQWHRLWRRSRGTAVWVAVNVACLASFAFVVPVALFVAGGLFTAQEDNWWFLAAGGVLGAIALPFGQRIWRWGRNTILEVTAQMVQLHTPSSDVTPARVTRMEGRAFRGLLAQVEGVVELAARAHEACDPQPLRVAAEEWQKEAKPLGSRVSFRNVDDRIEVVQRVLSRGCRDADPVNVRLFADIAQVVANDVGETFRRALRRQPMKQAGAMWPYVFDNFEREDVTSHGGEPIAFRGWLAEHRRQKPE